MILEETILQTSRRVYLVGMLMCVALLLAAAYFQHILLLEPCPLCILQRLMVMVTGGVFLLAFLHNPRGLANRIYGGLIVISTMIGAGISTRHVWLQNLPPELVPSCGPGLNFMLENFPLRRTIELVFRGSGECAEVDWSLLGLTIPAWTLIAFVVLGVLGLNRLLSQSRGRRMFSDKF